MMKKLVIYTENYEYGGLEKFIFDISSSMDKKSVLLICNADNERIQIFAKNHKIECKVVHVKNRGSFSRIKNSFIRRIFTGVLYRIIFRRLNYRHNYKTLLKEFSTLVDCQSILIVNGGYPAADSCRVATIAAKKAGFKNVILSILSVPVYHAKMLSSLPERLLDKKVKKCVDRFHVNCDASKKVLIEQFHFPESKIKRIYTGVEIPDEKYTNKYDVLVNNVVSIIKDPGDIIIGTVGLLTTMKGQQVLLVALRDLKEDGLLQNIRAIIVGDGPNLECLKRLVVKYDIKDHVVFTGKYPYSISDIYRIIDIFVFPSFYEGLPYSVSEAMSYGIPVIATDVGGIPEQVSDGVNGFLVEKGDYFTIEKNILLLSQVKSLRDNLGKKGREKAIASFSIDEMRRSITSIIEEGD